MDNKIVNESLIAGKGWFPSDVSTFGQNVDGLYNFILWGSVILFIGIIVVTTLFVIKYRKRPGYVQPAGKHITHHLGLELAWTVPPLILALFIFYWGFTGFLDMSVSPKQGEEVRVVAKKWMWQFEYKNGNKALSELVVPVNTPIVLVMNAEDVLHSFYVPNLRIKRDVIPNRYTKVWFEATRTGNFQIFCTEYCGDGHSEMQGTVRVVSQAEYKKWLADGGAVDESLPLDKVGEKVYTAKGCVACHSVDGSPKVGPSWKGIWGTTHQFVGGGSAAVDENYVKESIYDPHAKVVQGFQPVMPSYKGLLNDREIDGVIAYIKTLK
ncbi:cytochrome c oxidase subunit II [bacterium]|nr:cytochrome c oxidase subunit II [bacterium]